MLLVARGGRRPLTLSVAALAAILFMWNLSSFAYHRTGAQAWSNVDLAASPLTAPLALNLVLRFVGQLRRFRGVLIAVLFAFGALSLSALAAFFVPAAERFLVSPAWPAIHLLLTVPVIALGFTLLAALLAQADFEVFQADSTTAARALLERVPADLVITDLRMPGEDGMRLLQQVVQRWPEIPVIVLTAHGTVPLAVEAMRHGAFDFALKPFDREGILFSVQRALRVARCRETAPVAGAHRDMLGTSAVLEEARALLRKAARASATVLVRGESGTGKELAARAIHDQGPRRDGPFVKVHCAALPEALLESELFGYEKGAFTGATLRKPGRVELAEGGTLFLDEIGEISPTTQVKLLRLLQDKHFERLGGTQTLSADVRFVTASHRNLEAMVERGEFREDLFYRLNVIPIWIPPLRDRRDDIPHLATVFCANAAAANGRGTVTLDAGALEELRAHPWPGNVRQLQNFIERLVVLGDADVLTAADVRLELSRESGTAARSGDPSAASEPHEGALAPRVKDAEREAVKDALRRARDNRTVAARLLGVSRRTLYNKLRELGLE